MIGAPLYEGDYTFTLIQTVETDDGPVPWTLDSKTNGAVDTAGTVFAEGSEIANPWLGTAPIVFEPISFNLLPPFPIIIPLWESLSQ